MASVRNTTSSAATSADALLDAAREAILAVGWSRTTLTEVARRAGVSRMTIYRRWPDTQTLLADLMTREWAVVTAAVAAADADLPPLEAVVHGVVDTVRALRRDPLLGRVIELDPDLLLPYLLDRTGRAQEHVAEALEQLVERGQADGGVRAGDARTLARSVLLAAYGFTLSAHTMVAGRRRRADLAAFDDELATLVRRYLQP